MFCISVFLWLIDYRTSAVANIVYTVYTVYGVLLKCLKYAHYSSYRTASKWVIYCDMFGNNLCWIPSLISSVKTAKCRTWIWWMIQMVIILEYVCANLSSVNETPPHIDTKRHLLVFIFDRLYSNNHQSSFTALWIRVHECQQYKM